MIIQRSDWKKDKTFQLFIAGVHEFDSPIHCVCANKELVASADRATVEPTTSPPD